MKNSYLITIIITTFHNVTVFSVFFLLNKFSLGEPKKINLADPKSFIFFKKFKKKFKSNGI